VNTTVNESDGRRRRRKHSPEFKADAIAACRRPEVSIAAVALKRGLNANLLRRWVAESERDCDTGGAVATVATTVGAELARPAAPTPAFVPLALSPPVATPAHIRVELRRGDTAITVTWPSSAASECASWMRELLR
jgi:transposase